MSAKTPVVSVVIPAYNAEAYIERALGSLITQTCADWEAIVVDDCSSDNTRQKAEAASNWRIRVVQSLVRQQG